MTAVKTRLRKNDMVQVITGAEGGKKHAEGAEDAKLRGKRGKIVDIDRKRGRAIVEGLNMRFKHQRTSQDPNRPGGGRIEEEAPLPLSNLMLVCPKCDKATRVGIRVEEKEDANGQKRPNRVRVCKACEAEIPERIS